MENQRIKKQLDRETMEQKKIVSISILPMC